MSHTRFYNIRDLRHIQPVHDFGTALETGTSLVHAELDYSKSLSILNT